MLKAASAFLIVASLLGTASAQQIKEFNVSVGEKGTFSSSLRTQFIVSGDLPAVFPKPAKSLAAGFDCQKGLRFSSLTDEADTKAFTQKYKVTSSSKPPFASQISSFQFGCPQGKATVSSPRLWESLTMNETPSRLALLQNSLYDRIDRNVVFSKGRGAIVIAVGFESWVFNLEGGKFRALQVSGAASVSQGGQPQNVFLEGSLDKTIQISLARPFTIHVTQDQGKTWQNILINFPGNTMSFWASLKTPEGTVVPE